MAFGQPTRDRRTERHEATKREIVEAAWEVAREHGLAGLSLRDVAARVGMQPPSLYSYFASKHAIYDAMFAGAYDEILRRARAFGPVSDRASFKRHARAFVEFCLEDPARYQLLFQRTIPGFEPSPEAYAPAVELLGHGRAALAAVGIRGARAADVYTALVTGLTDQQLSNDPGGARWVRLLDEVLDMFLDRYSTKRRRPRP
ncbi:MAG TPA: TetR/AcrR family transcriptional regulator [Acidimicrobiales bacterium]